jgi:enoyl-CoA hydratase
VSVDVTLDGAVAVVTVNRPEAMNALDVATLTELRDRLLELRDDQAVRVVVLTGAGERAFIAGADIKAMSEMDVEHAKAWGGLGHEVAQLLETMPQPTIAAIDGFALGGGCELALACDLRYASPRSKLGQPEINLGIIPGWGGTQRLARVCGLGFAKELILTGRLVAAEEAQARGLVDAIHDPALDAALETARLLASKSPVALAAAKRALNYALQGDHVENLQREAEEFGSLFAGEDAKEGLAAFVEKREPRFRGR